jgi:hypothetical protein
MSDCGWASLALSPSRLLEAAAFGTNAITELPPALRVGRLSLETDRDPSGSAEDYLLESDYPALVSLRDVPAITFGPSDLSPKVPQMAQMSLVHLSTLLLPSTIKVTAIDLKHWGTSCSLLRAAIPKLNLVTSSQERSALVEALRQEVIERTSILGVRYSALFEYNAASTDSPQPYHFIYISNYTDDLTDDDRLLISSLVTPGPEGIPPAVRAGLYFFVIFNDWEANEKFLKQHGNIPSVIVEPSADKGFRIEINDPKGLNTTTGGEASPLHVIPDSLDPDTTQILVDRCNEHLSTSQLPPVLLPLDLSSAWKGSTKDGICVPIGKRGQEIVSMTLGNPDIVQHALVGGAVGTGKTILLHAIICQMLQKYSPAELKLSLLDYKEGTEFAIYSDAPHLFALSLGANVRFGIDLLQALRDEMSSRATLFKSHGVPDLDHYRKVTKQELCRHVVVIDEFQVLLNDQKHGSEAQRHLEDVIRRGRSSGINVVLSSQSLSDGSLPSAVRSNLGCRICLRLSERECLDFLSHDNTIASTFQHPGQAVYNNKEGRREGNIEFRVAFYQSHQIAQFLGSLANLAEQKNLPKEESFIYNGEKPLVLSLPDCCKSAEGILIAVKEGIPRVFHHVDLTSPKANPALFVAGEGASREALRDLIVTQLDHLGAMYLHLQETGEINEYCASVLASSDISPDRQIVLMEISRFLNDSREIKKACDLLQSRGSLLILFFDLAETAKSLGFEAKNFDYTICCDPRSVDRICFRAPDGLSEYLSNAIMVRPFEDPFLVRIPKITQ